MKSKKNTWKVSSPGKALGLWEPSFMLCSHSLGSMVKTKKKAQVTLGTPPGFTSLLFSPLLLHGAQKVLLSKAQPDLQWELTRCSSLVLQLTHPKIYIGLNWRGKEQWPFRIKSYVVLIMMMSIRIFPGTYNMVCTVLNVLYALSSLILTTNSVG